ncbi:tyrosine-protein phosphatase [Leifsonia sp. McL0607]|uniref:tyrosine-protein phosphatase n=1 Tax=Leifsonia sp. McL0607 TaxID=3415672 RepID=UPI003CFBA838
MSTHDEGTGGRATGVVADRIPVNGTYNFRDVGGYRVPEGVVRRGKLFRSDGLARLGDEGRQSLRELGVRVVIDLRDDFETQTMPDDVGGLDLQRLHLPVFEGSGASASTIGVTLVGLYEKILLQHRDVVVRALREIADTGEEAVVVHCTAGKDRTGIVVALALSAIGVDRETIVADYVATQANLDGLWLEGMIALVRSHGVEVTPDLRIILGGSPPEALEESLDLLDREFGGVHQYLFEAGLSEVELAKLRSVLVEPA